MDSALPRWRLRPDIRLEHQDLPATQLRRKGRKVKTNKTKQKMYRENPRTNGKSKPIQRKSHKEAYTYTLAKRGKGKKKYI